MCAYPYDPRSVSGVRSIFADLSKEIDTAFRPIHAARTLGKRTHSSDILFEPT
jgi:hypothetical protein